MRVEVLLSRRGQGAGSDDAQRRAIPAALASDACSSLPKLQRDVHFAYCEVAREPQSQSVPSGGRYGMTATPLVSRSRPAAVTAALRFVIIRLRQRTRFASLRSELSQCDRSSLRNPAAGLSGVPTAPKVDFDSEPASSSMEKRSKQFGIPAFVLQASA